MKHPSKCNPVHGWLSRILCPLWIHQVLLLLTLPAGVHAQFNYTINNGAITITGDPRGWFGPLIIPSTINGLPVTSIGDSAFSWVSLQTGQNSYQLTSVTIPNSITNIGNNAFGHSPILTSVTLGNGVTSIGNQAFGDCPGLTSITIPSSVTSISASAFAYCLALTAITVDALNPTYTSVDGVLFNKSQTTLIEYPGGKVGSYTIPNSVTSIGGKAFSGCANLTSVGIPDGVTSIGDAAFSSCTSLTDVTIGTGVTSIGQFAFSGCARLASVTIPNRVTSIPAWASDNCHSLTNVNIGNGVTSIGDWAFQYCYSLASVWIPSNVVSIPNDAFTKCTNLAAITVDVLNSMYSSVDGVLFNKNQTTLIQCPKGRAGDYGIPNNVTSIGAYAFSDCARLTGVTIPNGVTSIGEQAFYFCTGLISVSMPDSVTSIGSSAFYFCTNLTSVSIPNHVSSIFDATFQRCYRLSSVTIGNGVSAIGYGAFEFCPSLTNLTIGSSVTTIGKYAFAECTNLTDIFFQSNAPSADSFVFYNNNTTVYYLPGTTGWGPTFAGRPTAPWPSPTFQTPPQSQTAEAGSAVEFRVAARSVGDLPFRYLWFFNRTNRLTSTNSVLQLTDAQYSQAGAYSLVVTNAAGAVTSPPALLNVIAPVERRIVPALTLRGQPGTTLNLDFTPSMGPAPLWTTFDHVPLTQTSQWYFDLSSPLPPQGFYRAWQSSAGAPPVLDLHMVPAITLTGAIGSSVRLDYINQFGPIDAWATLATVTLTNTSQLYFDTSTIGQPPRLWRSCRCHSLIN